MSRGVYTPSATLYARRSLRFAGADYVRGAELPPMLPAKRFEMWLAGKASTVAPRKPATTPKRRRAKA